MNMENFMRGDCLELHINIQEFNYCKTDFFVPAGKVNLDDAIQKTNLKNEFLVPSTKENSGLIYIVITEIGACSVGLPGAPSLEIRHVEMEIGMGISNNTLISDRRGPTEHDEERKLIFLILLHFKSS
ncbi:hypothetical protein GLOIN_2v1783985 [Rhizophagus clarus]|uniref:Uncharacterized protein n=1 Tax=Rhizophagus clarus TaxID=94130 RepID=A0A8H3L467_9GLOM|nr:hypothetical protein GLOIN_2v1783985 [Rhizophagus clarus]